MKIVAQRLYLQNEYGKYNSGTENVNIDTRSNRFRIIFKSFCRIVFWWRQVSDQHTPICVSKVKSLKCNKRLNIFWSNHWGIKCYKIFCFIYEQIHGSICLYLLTKKQHILTICVHRNQSCDAKFNIKANLRINKLKS